jgi:hypothetical protein
MKKEISFRFSTGTATLCVFDLECLKHRLNDDADWWSMPEEELIEVNAGNVAFIGLNDDGGYTVLVVDEMPIFDAEFSIKVPSGKIFIGAGEEVTSAGLEPEGLLGVFRQLPIGNYSLRVRRSEVDREVEIAVTPGTVGKNNFSTPVKI